MSCGNIGFGYVLVFSSCQAATANANPLTEDTQSVTSEYTLEEFRQKIQPEITELLQNQIDYNSDWQDKVGENYIEYNRNGADEYTAATVNDYIEKIHATKTIILKYGWEDIKLLLQIRSLFKESPSFWIR